VTGSTLTINAGVTVYYEPGASIVLKGAQLLVLGTPLAPVVFAPQPTSDGSTCSGLVFQSGFNYSSMILQNAIFINLGNALIDSVVAGPNVGALSATNLTFNSTNAALAPAVTVGGLVLISTNASFASTTLLSSISCLASSLSFGGWNPVSLTGGILSACAITSNTNNPFTLAGIQSTNGSLNLNVQYGWQASSSFLISASTFNSTKIAWNVGGWFHTYSLSFVGCSLSNVSASFYPGPSDSLLASFDNSYINQGTWAIGVPMSIINSSWVLGSAGTFMVTGGLTASSSAFDFSSMATGFPVTNAAFSGCTLVGGGHNTGLVVDGSLLMNGSSLSGVDTLFVLNPDSTNVVVANSILTSSLTSAGSAPPYLVNNSSPYGANMQHNFWGSGFQAQTGTNALNGAPQYALSSFIYDFIIDVNLGIVTFLPFSQ
jgi:hypothetical protein